MNETNYHTPLSVADLEQNTSNEAEGSHAAKEINTPVSINVHSVRKRVGDVDGISAKAAIDGLITGGLLRDDSPRFVNRVSYTQEPGKEEKTIITITDEL